MGELSIINFNKNVNKYKYWREAKVARLDFNLTKLTVCLSQTKNPDLQLKSARIPWDFLFGHARKPVPIIQITSVSSMYEVIGSKVEQLTQNPTNLGLLTTVISTSGPSLAQFSIPAGVCGLSLQRWEREAGILI